MKSSTSGISRNYLKAMAFFSLLIFSTGIRASSPCGLSLSLSGSATSCVGHDTLYLQGASTGSQIVWQYGSGSATIDSAGGTIDTTFIPTVAGSYIAIVTDPGGCLDTSAAIVVDSAVTPTVSISINTSDTICSGTSVTFTPTPINGGTPSYQWYLNGNPISTAGLYTNNTLNNNDSIWVVMTGSAPCSTTYTATSNVIQFTVNAPATPGVTISSLNTGDTICYNTMANLIATGTNGGINPDYQWQRNGINVGNSSTYIANTILNGDVYTCIITSTAQCLTRSRDTSAPITFTVNPYPVVTVTQGGGSTACSGDSIGLIASGGVSYLWSNGDTTASIFATTGTYTVTAANSYGCTAGSAPLAVTPHAPLADSLAQTGDTLVLVTTGGEFYQWYYDDSIIANAVGTTYIATQTGSYQIAVIDSFGCLTSSSIVYIVQAGINTIAADPTIRLYPNPNSGSFTLVCSDDMSRTATVTDELGRTILSDIDIRERQQFSLPTLSDGIYYLRLSDGQTTKTLKFSVAK